MKKTIFSITLCLIISLGEISAQISQGTFLVGASSDLGFSSVSTETDDNLNSFSIGLSGGYFVIDNLAVGLSFGYSKYTYGDISGSSNSFGLFGRYYVDGKVFGGLGYSTSSFGESETTTALPIEVGYAAFVTDNIAIEPSLSYSIGMGDNDSNTLGLNVGFMLYFNRQ